MDQAPKCTNPNRVFGQFAITVYTIRLGLRRLSSKNIPDRDPQDQNQPSV